MGLIGPANAALNTVTDNTIKAHQEFKKEKKKHKNSDDEDSLVEHHKKKGKKPEKKHKTKGKGDVELEEVTIESDDELVISPPQQR